MRLSKSEVERRKNAVLAYFRKNPTASVAKMNKALTTGELTGKPEKMLNIATGYKWREEAKQNPELPLTPQQVATKALADDIDQNVLQSLSERLDAQGVPESPLIGGTPQTLQQVAENIQPLKVEHSDHGRGDDNGPFDEDCPCRETPDQAACAKAGCGFCKP